MTAQTEIREFFSGLRGEIRALEPMSRHTSLGMGGPADIFIVPGDVEALSEVVKISRRHGIPLTPVGGGTNLLVGDGGIEGAAVSLRGINAINVDEGDGAVNVAVGAGFSLQRLIGLSRERGLSGIEGLAGIPGQAGGAVAGNAGAFGFEMKDAFVKASVMNMDGEIFEVDKKGMGFAYRRAAVPGGSIIIGATLRLFRDDPDAVAKRIEGFLKEKKSRQPIGARSAGCVFKNPGGDVPPAGRLIDDAGLKGMRVGDVEVSEVHANFFINRGEGTSDDFLKLMDAVSKKIRERFGVELEPEIRVVGRMKI